MIQKEGTNGDHFGSIELQQTDSHSTNICLGDDQCTAELKVISPAISSRMKQPNDRRSLRINGSNVRPLEAITFQTTAGQVIHHSLASVLEGDDVIGLKWEKRLCLGEETIFTLKMGPFSNRISYGDRDVDGHPPIPLQTGFQHTHKQLSSTKVGHLITFFGG